jgi:hypothetical protein
MYFTVAHLYGHLTQMLRPTPDMMRGIDLSGPHRKFDNSEVQAVYDYEHQAAMVGRRLVGELGPVRRELDRQYTRLFLADFHYLIHTLETGEQGVECFETFLRREPVPFRLIEPDPRPLINVAGLANTAPGGVTVL